jgi:beta-carotene hydroxylase
VIAPGIVQDENIFAKKMYQEKPNWFWQYVLELVIVLGVKFSLLLFVDWKLALLLIFIPHLFAAWGIVGTNYWQHDGCDRDDPNNHSRNFEGKFINFIAFNNGFHAAHHEAPHLHWSLLPAYHYEHIKPKTHPNLCLKNLFPYLWKTCIYPGKRLDYLGNPVLLLDEKYEDWIPSADVEKHKNQLGVES